MMLYVDPPHHGEDVCACFCCIHIPVNGLKMGRTLHSFYTGNRLINVIDALMVHFISLNTGGKYIPFCEDCGCYDSRSIDGKKQERSLVSQEEMSGV